MRPNLETFKHLNLLLLRCRIQTFEITLYCKCGETNKHSNLELKNNARFLIESEYCGQMTRLTTTHPESSLQHCEPPSDSALISPSLCKQWYMTEGIPQLKLTERATAARSKKGIHNAGIQFRIEPALLEISVQHAPRRVLSLHYCSFRIYYGFE